MKTIAKTLTILLLLAFTVTVRAVYTISTLPQTNVISGGDLIMFDKLTNSSIPAYRTMSIAGSNLIVNVTGQAGGFSTMPDIYRIRTTSVLSPPTDLSWDVNANAVFGATASQQKLATYRWDNGFFSCGENGTPSQSFSAFNFYVPPGTTNATFTGWFQSQTNVNMNEAFVWCNPGGLAAFNPTINSTWTFVSNSIALNSAMSGGTNLFIAIKRDQSNPGTYGWNVSNEMVTLLPTPSNLPNPFYRYAITPDIIQKSMFVAQGFSNAPVSSLFSCYGASGGSYIDFQTTETNLALEVDVNGNTGVVLPWTALINGQTYSFNFATSPRIQVTNIVLPAGLNSVRLITPAAVNDTYSVPFPWRAVYTSTNSTTIFARGGDCKIAVVGDSIATGFYATNQYANIWGTVSQVTGAEVRNFSSGGMAAFLLSGMNMFSLQQQLAQYQPDIIWLSLGFNDNYHGYWTGTNQFTGGYSNVLVQIHTVCPGALIVAQAPTYSATAGTQNYGIAIQQAVNTSPDSQFVYFVNGFPWYTAYDLQSDPHPSDYGNAKLAYNIIDTLETLSVSPLTSARHSMTFTPAPIAGFYSGTWNGSTAMYCGFGSAIFASLPAYTFDNFATNDVALTMPIMVPPNVSNSACYFGVWEQNSNSQHFLQSPTFGITNATGVPTNFLYSVDLGKPTLPGDINYQPLFYPGGPSNIYFGPIQIIVQ